MNLLFVSLQELKIDHLVDFHELSWLVQYINRNKKSRFHVIIAIGLVSDQQISHTNSTLQVFVPTTILKFGIKYLRRTFSVEYFSLLK